jgi:hypothetical protein
MGGCSEKLFALEADHSLSAYTDPDGAKGLQVAKDQEARLLRRCQELDRQRLEAEMLKLQQSQRLATWASLAVALRSVSRLLPKPLSLWSRR